MPQGHPVLLMKVLGIGRTFGVPNIILCWVGMARPLEIEFPGAIYHVISRGNRKQTSTPGSLRGPAKPVRGRRPAKP